MKTCEACGQKYEDRFFCGICPEEAANDYHPRRCSRCHMEHKRDVHGIEPQRVACTVCKQDLGLYAVHFSKAGAPWCGECPPWWCQ